MIYRFLFLGLEHIKRILVLNVRSSVFILYVDIALENKTKQTNHDVLKNSISILRCKVLSKKTYLQLYILASVSRNLNLNPTGLKRSWVPTRKDPVTPWQDYMVMTCTVFPQRHHDHFFR